MDRHVEMRGKVELIISLQCFLKPENNCRDLAALAGWVLVRRYFLVPGVISSSFQDTDTRSGTNGVRIAIVATATVHVHNHPVDHIGCGEITN